MVTMATKSAILTTTGPRVTPRPSQPIPVPSQPTLSPNSITPSSTPSSPPPPPPPFLSSVTSETLINSISSSLSQTVSVRIPHTSINSVNVNQNQKKQYLQHCLTVNYIQIIATNTTYTSIVSQQHTHHHIGCCL